MNMKEIRAILGVSRAEFSRMYGIPIRTLEDWDAGKSKPPEWALKLLERAVSEDEEYLRKCPSCQRFFIDRRRGNIKFCPDCNKKGNTKLAQYDARKNNVRWKHKVISDYIRNVLNDDPEEFQKRSNKFYQDVKSGTKTENDYRIWLEEASAMFKEIRKHS